MESSHSGLVRRTRNALGEQSPQRFKSSTLRNNKCRESGVCYIKEIKLRI